MWRLAQAQPNRFIHPKAEGNSLDTSSTAFQPRQLDLISLFPFPHLPSSHSEEKLRLAEDVTRLESENLVVMTVFAGKSESGL